MILASLLFIFYTHAYLGIISALFALLSYFFLFFFKKEIRKIKYLVHILLQVFIPILIFLILNNLTDFHTNRSDCPAGTYEYVSNLNTIFLPYDTLLQKIYLSFVNIGFQQWEGVNYIGLVSNGVIVAMFFVFIVGMIKSRNLKTFNDIFPAMIWAFFIASIILLIISMATPIKFIIDFLFEKIKELRQFRALGRFAWPFYYVIGIISMIFIYNLYRKYSLMNKKILSTLLFIVPLFIFLSEAFVFQLSYSKTALNSPNYLNENYIPAGMKKSMESFDKDSFQAIIPLPFYHYGSEDFMIASNVSDKSIIYSQIFAYNKNMSMMSSNSPRTSVDEAKKIIQILMPEFYSKSIKTQLPNRKPFLILYTKDILSPYEERILNLSEKFYEDNQVILAKLDFEKLFYETQNEILKRYINIDDDKYRKNDFYVSDSNAFIYYDGFNIDECGIKHSGSSCFRNIKNAFSSLAEISAKDLDLNTEYEASFWFYNKGHGRTAGLIAIDEMDKDQGSSSWIGLTDARFSYVIDGEWSLVQTRFKPKSKNCHYKIFLAPSENWIDSIYVDDILIKPVNVDVFKVFRGENNKGILFYNNYFIKTDIDYSILSCKKSQLIEYYINKIKNSVSWYNTLKSEAKNKSIALDKYIYDNAEYMVLYSPFKIEDNKLLKIIYYKDLIKSNKEWLNKIILENKAKESLDSIIMHNALYMIDLEEKSQKK
ncbi:MAG: hypothetical protein HPY79_01885 [Bacteroidales bacterium]|nr:hypothetical protein [Bacteroidales bacterium]